MLETDKARIAEIKLLFSDRAYMLYLPRKFGEMRERELAPAQWVARYARKGSKGEASGYGIGSTPVEAAENAWKAFAGVSEQ
jgi:hypothetical protein